MIMYHLGPQLGVWIMQVSTFSSVLINRFHCIHKVDYDSENVCSTLDVQIRSVFSHFVLIFI